MKRLLHHGGPTPLLGLAMLTSCGLESFDEDVNVVPAQAAPIVRCGVEDASPPWVYARRVKRLLAGAALTDDELLIVMDDPSQFESLVRDWMDTPAFEQKLSAWFQSTLQVDHGESVLQGIRNSNAGKPLPRELHEAVRASLVQTALAIVQERRPFTELVEGRTWRLNTATMATLSALEGPIPALEELVFYTAPFVRDGVRYDANTPLEEQIAGAAFHAPPGAETCGSDPLVFGSAADPRRINGETFVGLFGGSGPQRCVTDITLFEPEDYVDWRDVTLVEATLDEVIPFWDLPTLREAEELPLFTPRTGFFSHPSFLASWPTNEDNSFRVTTNQVLIVALGLQFDSDDVTIPLGDEGLAAEHAGPQTVCYGCHKNLDPMRNYFQNSFAQPFYAAPVPDEHSMERATFSFAGHQGGTSSTGESLRDLGRHLAEHPRFASAWVQKLCTWANSAKCDEEDPAFQAVVDRFEASGMDFWEMAVTLFSSRLVTLSACGTSPFPDGSLSRQEHLCVALSERLDIDDVCNLPRNAATTLARTIPAVDWSRGSQTPELISEPSLLSTASLHAFCKTVGRTAVSQTPQLQTSDMEASTSFLVTDLMGLPASDPRHDEVLAVMNDHLAQIREVDGVSDATRLQSLFTLACTSPFVGLMDL